MNADNMILSYYKKSIKMKDEYINNLEFVKSNCYLYIFESINNDKKIKEYRIDKLENESIYIDKENNNTEWNDNNNLNFFEIYYKGELESMYSEWYDDNNIKHGEYIQWLPNNQEIYELYYINNKLYKNTITNELRNKKFEAIYKDDVLLTFRKHHL